MVLFTTMLVVKYAPSSDQIRAPKTEDAETFGDNNIV